MENIVVSIPTENCLNCGIRFSNEIPSSELELGGLVANESRSLAVCKVRAFTSNLGRGVEAVEVQVKDAIEEIFSLLEMTNFSSTAVDCGVCGNCCMILATIYDLVVMLKSRRSPDTPEPFLWSIVEIFKSNLDTLMNKTTSDSSPINERSTADGEAEVEDGDSDCIIIEDDGDVILLDEPVESNITDECVDTSPTSSGQKWCTCTRYSSENSVTGSELHNMYLEMEKVREDGLFECRACNKVLMSKWSIRRHIRSIHLKLRKKCKYCDVEHGESYIKRHMDACSKKLT